MITYGFFNSINGDRTYNADQMSTYFEGLVSDGVYENVGNALQVRASSGMTVAVQTGRALVDSKWVKVDAVENIELSAAHVTLNRYTAIVVQLDRSNRLIQIVAKDGANATNPSKPAIVNDAYIKELCLAYIYVPAGASAISQSNITDTRANTSICGWVTGIVQQVDTSELFLQWQTAYEEYFADMEAWKAEQQRLFETWFSSLTGQLQVNTYIEKYHNVVETTDEQGVFALNMAGYTYDASDVIMVNINGVVMTEDYDYIIDTSKTPVEMHTRVGVEPDNLIEITVLKSKIGQS